MAWLGSCQILLSDTSPFLGFCIAHVHNYCCPKASPKLATVEPLSYGPHSYGRFSFLKLNKYLVSIKIAIKRIRSNQILLNITKL